GEDFFSKLRTRVASYFIRSAEAFSQGTSIPVEWESCFSHAGLSPVQYKLPGVNAHINGDLWQALTAEFSLEELRENKASYLKSNKGLLKIYNDFYHESFEASRKIRMPNAFSAGWINADEKMGKRLMKLAILFYTNKKEFDYRLRKLRFKMSRINRMILHTI
ncbi:MAG TPA: DUF5995 family protein, partial [Chitinophagaceae bacterium]|nr:DUF5995 family protein [Chitinophagaceae bacterium]